MQPLPDWLMTPGGGTGRLPHIVDIGASPVDGEAPYAAMLKAGLCRVTGFEPQAEWRAELERRRGPHETYRGEVVLDGQPAVLNVTEWPGLTSLLVPDIDTLKLFPRFPAMAQISERRPTQTVTLDSAIDEPVDFLKLDVQGVELKILQHAPRIVGEIIALQIEISFMPLYRGQPAIGEVDSWLRGVGFLPHAFAQLKTWPIHDEGEEAPAQLLEADIIYVRDFRRRENLTREQWRHLAVLGRHYFRSRGLTSLAVTNAG